MPGDHRLEARRLVRSFGGRRVLDGLDLALGPGEVVGLLGPNGAGKTTAIRIVMGFERPDSGDVTLGGRSILALAVEERARLGIGYLPQEPSIFPDLGVRDNLVIVLEALGRDVAGVDALLGEMEIGHLASERAGNLSGGERRRLELARLLSLDAALLLLDEPFTGMDPMSIERIAGVVHRLRDGGRGVLVSDHNVRQAMRLCDRVCLVDGGAVLVAGTPGDVRRDPVARERYLGADFEA
jgi:lipopolysaccharide export system ATP-binding protein